MSIKIFKELTDQSPPWWQVSALIKVWLSWKRCCWQKYTKTPLHILLIFRDNFNVVIWVPFQYLMRRLIASRSCKISSFNRRIALKCDKHIGSCAAEVPVKFRAIRQFLTETSLLRDFVISYNKTSYLTLTQGSGSRDEINLFIPPKIIITCN